MSEEKHNTKEKIPELVETGNRIADTRDARSITQEDLGSRVGINGNAVSRIETGKNNLRVVTFYKIATALQVTPNDLCPEYLLNGTPLERYSLLNPKSRNSLRQFIDVLLSGQNDPS